jgi:hypothetical protein
MDKKLSRKERDSLVGKTIGEVAKQYSIPPNRIKGEDLLQLEPKPKKGPNL